MTSFLIFCLTFILFRLGNRYCVNLSSWKDYLIKFQIKVLTLEYREVCVKLGRYCPCNFHTSIKAYTMVSSGDFSLTVIFISFIHWQKSVWCLMRLLRIRNAMCSRRGRRRGSTREGESTLPRLLNKSSQLHI